MLAAGPHRLFASPGSDQSSTAVDTRTRVLGYVNVEEMVYYASASPSDLLGLGQREKPIVIGRRELQGPGRDRTDMALAESVEHVIEHLPGDAVTLREVLDVIGREGMLVFCIFLALPFMVPVSIPGVSTAFGLVMGLIGVGIMADRHPWLPDRLMRKRFPADRLRLALEKGSVWIHRLGRISRPSIPVLTHGMGMARVNGLMLIAGALLLMAPFGLIPFSNTLPGVAILFLAIGMLQRDGRSILLGYATIVLSALYFAFLLLGGIAVLQGVIDWIGIA